MTRDTFLNRAAGAADSLTRLGAAAVFVAGTSGLLTGWLQPHVQGWLGITDITRRLAALEARIPAERIALFDASLSYIVGDCRIGDVCTARMRLKRTETGAHCKLVEVRPYVLNHNGIRHPAEYLAGAVDARGDWETVSIRFRAPDAAVAGRAAYQSRQYYQCEIGTVHEDSITLTFFLSGAEAPTR